MILDHLIIRDLVSTAKYQRSFSHHIKSPSSSSRRNGLAGDDGAGRSALRDAGVAHPLAVSVAPGLAHVVPAVPVGAAGAGACGVPAAVDATVRAAGRAEPAGLGAVLPKVHQYDILSVCILEERLFHIS